MEKKSLELQSFSFIKERLVKIPYQFAKTYSVLPLEEKEDSFLVAMCDPLNLAPLKELRLILGKKIETFLTSAVAIEKAIEECYGQKEEETASFLSQLEKESVSTSERTNEGYDLLEFSDENPVVRLLNTIIADGIRQGASDIHFEPQEKGMKIRYRIDGVLLSRHSPPSKYQEKILTRLKVLAKLDIAEHRLPQDGRIKLKLGKREIDFRVSTIPVIYGERIVLRILDKKNLLIGMDRLGMGEKILEQFLELIQLSEGIVLVTGPTGSGKTTSLYSALSEIDTKERNVMTIEDPVEYKLPMIAQIGVNPKISLTFAKGLRHILRQDPDVIMVGEIRDKETAEIAIQAALTGHLVFSTLHTNNAPSALTRLVDMEIESYLLSSSIVGIIAQRLVRKICSKCRKAYEPSTKELEKLRLSQQDLSEGVLYLGEGCSHCFQTGYKGRIGIFELMMMSPQVKSQLLKSAEAEELRRVAIKEKMIDLFSSGVELVKRGITTSSEIFRVIHTQKIE